MRGAKQYGLGLLFPRDVKLQVQMRAKTTAQGIHEQWVSLHR
jgi:hypothetical protein